MSRESKSQIRCAVYTRKSSENGLEQEFNSLDAQRESSEAYIKSQQHEGWVLIKDQYNDGGFSGGNTERPGLKQLLEDIADGNINVVVVYKVDRLTRSLSDFAKLVELFDAHGVSFVSVTQQFNTTSSMGRLTLNVLLSFAQFEREVTGERIRDKVEASRKKGIWMGGHPPLGYDIIDRKLIVNDAEAKTVRHIFKRYLELKSVSTLKAELEQNGYRSKQWTSSSNKTYGGKPFKRGALYYILRNRLYVGDAVHKGNAYPGEHEAIINAETWSRVKNLLKQNATHHEKGLNHRQPSLLRGLLFDDRGNHMSPSHANKKGRRYRYYVSQALTQQRKSEAGSITRIPAHDIEALVREQVEQVIGSNEALKGLGAIWPTLEAGKQSELIRLIVQRVTVGNTEVGIEVSERVLDCVCQNRLWESEEGIDLNGDEMEPVELLEIKVPVVIKKNGSEKVIVLPGTMTNDDQPSPHAAMITAIVKAHDWFAKLQSGEVKSLHELSQRLNMNRRYVARLLRLAFLAPDIVESILDGTQPRSLSLYDLIKPMPVDWDGQRKTLGFATS
ncbi:MAG: recombinase family protein [Rhodospirillaceae bacterium]